jgi:putative ATP-dependent endonuclease of the OLD family
MLTAIELRHFGPFAVDTTISIDPDLTILTGPNDVGKSNVLTAIEMFLGKAPAQEHHVNSERLGGFAGSWNQDTEVEIRAEFSFIESSRFLRLFKGDAQVGDKALVQLKLNHIEGGYVVLHHRRGGQNVVPAVRLRPPLPSVVKLGSDASIRNAIPLERMTNSEIQLMRLAFGPEFAPGSLLSLSPHLRGIRIRQAEDVVNERLSRFFPKTLPLQFQLIDLGAEGKQIGINLVDPVKAFVPVQTRGDGVKKLISYMCLLLQGIDPHVHSIVLVDEPEAALHADAQHQLRRMLEDISRLPNAQVIYATHSPAMINPSTPHRIRLFSRRTNDGKATTHVEHSPYGDNFQRVRISLGLTPSDSLLFGSVTVIVEGDTEVRCLEPLLRKLDDAEIEAFKGASLLLNECHFVCGEGDNIPKYCRIAVSQNARPVVLVDGDKFSMIEQLRKNFPSVPIVELPKGKEFEDIVPRELYVRAVAGILNEPAVEQNVTLDEFKKWADGKPLEGRVMFSKQVENWLRDIHFVNGYNKHFAMAKAIELAEAGDFDTSTLRH